ncbi:hypothetical protein R6Q57_011090 [Mikania cordata]
MASSKANATSPSSKPTRGCTYDVFLSFRGEDTRYTFVDHLYAALVQKGLHVFKDDEMIHKGKPISLKLTHAIEESRFAVVVLSKSYSDSSWCLEELVKIIKCRDQMGLMVLPVFIMLIHLMCVNRKETMLMLFKNMKRTRLMTMLTTRGML